MSKMFCNKSCLLERSENNGKDKIVYHRYLKKPNKNLILWNSCTLLWWIFGVVIWSSHNVTFFSLPLLFVFIKFFFLWSSLQKHGRKGTPLMSYDEWRTFVDHQINPFCSFYKHKTTFFPFVSLKQLIFF